MSESYQKKLAHIQGLDPYSLKPSDLNEPLEDIPKISKAIIIDYLFFRSSPETSEQIRACKSLDGFAQFACKWIEAIGAKRIGTNIIILGKVKHSQRISEPPLKPWIILSSSAEVLACHCNCVAGLGEVCTHIASMLFALEFAGKNEGESVTDVLAYWIGPSKKDRFYKKLADIDFTSPSSVLKGDSEEKPESEPEIPPLNDSEIRDLFEEIESLNIMSACMIPYSKNRLGLISDLPQPLISINAEKWYNLNLNELQKVGETIDISLSQEQADLIFEKTVEQTSSDLWFQFRMGRVTASKFKSTCRTKLTKPSISLIKSVCYGNRNKKLFKAGAYGCQHENEAREEYLKRHKENHPSAVIKKCGLIIDPKFPFFGASPDGLLVCDECGEGCLEIKCPYCVRDAPVEEILKLKSSYLKAESGSVHLSKDHTYYYQVQMQMALSHKNFCDFVVWSPHSLFEERISFNKSFWETESKKAAEFFHKVIMPQLLAEYFTKNVKSHPEEKTSLKENLIQDVNEPSTSHTSRMPCDTSSSESHPTQDAPVWCICKQPDNGTKMVMCENRDCPIQWFHLKCLKVSKLPRGKWFCNECRKK